MRCSLDERDNPGTIEDVRRVRGKAIGPDGISSRGLKELADELATAITLLFRSSLLTGTVAADKKYAFVMPFSKKEERYRTGNYSSISLKVSPTN